jgi:hypothetical protein
LHFRAVRREPDVSEENIAIYLQRKKKKRKKKETQKAKGKETQITLCFCYFSPIHLALPKPYSVPTKKTLLLCMELSSL